MQFSSRQDLIDAVWLIPMIIGIAILIYIFGVDVLGLLYKIDQTGMLTRFLKTIGTIAAVTAVTHVVIIGLGKLIDRIKHHNHSHGHHA
jgi:hypothetical protein